MAIMSLRCAAIVVLLVKKGYKLVRTPLLYYTVLYNNYWRYSYYFSAIIIIQLTSVQYFAVLIEPNTGINKCTAKGR